jgi:hypothetical protein
MSQPIEQLGPEVMAAIISGGISLLVGVVTAGVSIIVARQNAVSASTLKTRELLTQVELKTRELSDQAEQKLRELRSHSESMRQAQMTDIVRKRIETYPKLYEIISIYGRNWELEGKVRDRAWASAFLMELINNNAVNGAFFSNVVYVWYGILRSFLEELLKNEDFAIKGEASKKQEAKLYAIIRGPEIQLKGEKHLFPGLGSVIKDELGSYIVSAISVTHSDDSKTTEGLATRLDDLLVAWEKQYKDADSGASPRKDFA